MTKEEKFLHKALLYYMPHNVMYVDQAEWPGKTFQLIPSDLQDDPMNVFRMDYKLELHPVDMLVGKIDYDGKEVVPMEELAKLSMAEKYDGEWEYQDLEFLEHGVRLGGSESEDVYFVDWKYIGSLRQTLSFKEGDFMMTTYQPGNQWSTLQLKVLNNQLDLFDKCFEMHIDILGLLDKNLAVKKTA